MFLDFGGYQKNTLNISFPEHRQDEYRIMIRNEDNPPLKITGVKTRGNVYRAVFLAAENETYHLYYGSDQAKPPKYEAMAVLAPLRQGHAVNEVRLGEEISNPTVGKPGFTVYGLFNNKVFLGVVIVALVAGLGWALFLATQRINTLPKE